MNILISFSTLKKGGGQNVALNFLSSFKNISSDTDSFFFFVVKDSTIHNYLEKKGYKRFKTVPANPILRILFEVFLSRYVLKKERIDIIYSYMGFGFYPRQFLQVSGCAVSNLYFPEIDFWKDYSGISLMKYRIIDYYRTLGLYRSDGIVFENKLMEIRSKELYLFKAITTTIKPSISLDFEKEKYSLPLEASNSTFKGLFLCGWHLHKNVMLIPEIASHLRSLNIDFHFIITAPLDNSPLHNKFVELLKKYNVIDMVSIVGPIKKEQLPSLYSQIDIVFLLSLLESFSNNIIEAWTYQRVLMVSDALWAQSLCKDAAVYVDRNSAKSIANKINELVQNKSLYESIVEKGLKEYKTYPTLDERTAQELSFLKEVYETH